MNNFLWWRDGVIYQIYPRSFADSNADGVGDLPGITARLDYLSDLGVDALWLSPIYPSPNVDFGYDVANYVDVDPLFGSLGDFDLLLAEAHQRGIHIILDLVLNHTSDRHPWFLESRSSRDNPKRDWYMWRDKPNNWGSVFGGSGWEYDEKTGQYYFHMFYKEQPDLNWRNPEVRHAILDSVRFWLDRGVDGFRLDVFNAFFKHADLLDNPPAMGIRRFDRQKHIYDVSQPEMYPFLRELRQLLDSYPERYAVGETFLATPEQTASYCGDDLLHAAFNFDFLERHWGAGNFLDSIQKWEKELGGRAWPNYVLGNHDNPRTATRYAHGEDDARAKVAMAMLLTLRGTPFLYYGEEIGMRDIPVHRSEIQDPIGKYYWPIYKGRDGCRSPMQWDDTPNAGFSTGKPWLKLNSDFPERNAQKQKADENSLFNLTRSLLALRKANPALMQGTFELLTPHPREALAYLRQTPEQEILVALNFTNGSAHINIPEHDWIVLLSTEQKISQKGKDLILKPYEVCILRRQ